MATRSGRDEKVDWSDVQGIVYRGYVAHKRSNLVLLKITDRRKAGRWLEGLDQYIVSASEMIEGPIDEDRCHLTVAISAPGLKALGFDNDEILQFSEEYVAGMAPKPVDGEKTTRRSGMLGDSGPNSPQNWDWGGYDGEKQPGKENHQKKALMANVHVMINLYGPSDRDVNTMFKKIISAKSGVELSCKDNSKGGYTTRFSTYLRADGREHFGYRDGVSQPVIKGTARAKQLSDKQRDLHCVAPGEFLLGYKSEHEQPVPVPHVKMDANGKISDIDKGFPIGRNGSFLAVRQLQQHVENFHKMLAAQAKSFRDFDKADEGKEWVAARVLGRQSDGYPLAPASSEFSKPPIPTNYIAEQPHPASDNKSAGEKPEGLDAYPNDFTYSDLDPDGLTNPLTSHIRRSFPRDILGPDARIAQKIASRHRILRRGRLYGPNPRKEMNEQDAEVTNDQDGQCGLFFIALNADLASQFETVQHSWVNNRHSAGQYREIDVIAGQGEGGTRYHTIQQRPANIRIREMKHFVTVRGGGYFFLPGLRALRVLAKIACCR